MTDKQKLFVDEYLIDLNATRAYKAAYPRIKDDNVAKAAASRLLANVNVKVKIQERMKDREKRTEITQDKVIAELAQIAFANGTDFAKVVEKQVIKEDGSLMLDPVTGKPMYYKTVDLELTQNLSKEKKKAIASIKMGKHGIEVGTCDKVRALELLGRHLGMWSDKMEIKGEVNVNNPYKNLSEEDLIKLAKME